MIALQRFGLHVSQEVQRDFPGYGSLVLYADGLSDGADERRKSMIVLREQETRVRSQFGFGTAAEHPHVQAWRNAFEKFGAKPNRHLCGAEALLRRVLSGGMLPELPAAVNIYNAISVQHAVPAGGEDWERLTSNLELRYAHGDEEFIGLDGEREAPRKGEVIWADSSGATCRRWNWRQSERTAVRSDTTSVYFVIDILPPYGEEELLAAGQDLRDLLVQVFPRARVHMDVLAQP
jgi:DNA/RNA-binding domain of Phe-tRNA-synthetase-like protein